MRGSWFLVGYPNGIRQVYALNKNEARKIAVERWGSEPVWVEFGWDE